MQEWLAGTHAEELAVFCAVARCRSFARAADQLHRDASLVSRRIRLLERRLGVRLFERTTRRVALTEAGTTLYGRVRHLFAELHAAESEVASLGREPRGRLRIAVPATFGRLWIAPRLPEFLAAHPQIRVEVDFADRFVDLVAESFDVAIRIGALRDSGLVARRLAVHRRVLCAAPEYLERVGVPADVSDLADHACLGFTGVGTHPVWRLTRGDRTVAVSTRGPLVSNDAETLIAAAVAGHGIMLCADWLVGRHLTDGRLVPVLADWAWEGDGGIHLVLPSRAQGSAKVRAFVEWIVTVVTPTPPWTRNDATPRARDAHRVARRRASR